MKIIFLDHDGVICLPYNWGTRILKQIEYQKHNKLDFKNIPIEIRHDDFDKESVSVLNEIIDMTDAEIVVSSDWRYSSSLDELGKYYEIQGIIKKPIDVTPYTNHERMLKRGIAKKQYFEYRSHETEKNRTFDINEWLFDNKNKVDKWVSVDDLDLRKNGKYMTIPFEHEWGLENFVYVNNIYGGIKNVKDQIIKYL